MPVSKTAKASPLGLEKAKQALVQKGWQKNSPIFLDTACVSAATLKRFWRSVPIGQDSFQAICRAINIDSGEIIESIEQLSGQPSATDGWPDSWPNSWVGRSALVSKLQASITGTTRLLSLTGLTGIGKTALADHLAKTLGHEGYTCVHLHCDRSKPLTLAELAHALSQKAVSPDPIRLNFYRLIDHLKQHRYLFLIDEIEHLLNTEPDTCLSHFQNRIWPDFFQAILKADVFESRFIITSQDLPNELDMLGDRWPDRWCAQALGGLSPDAQMLLFQKMGLSPAPDSAASRALSRIGCAYQGHPLSLRVVALEIATTFQGSISAYWHEHGWAIGSDTALPDLLPDLHRHSQDFCNRVQPRIKAALLRLKHQLPDAYELLFQAGSSQPCRRRPRLRQSWLQSAQQMGIEPNRARLLIEALCDRAFLVPTVIDHRLYFSPHPLAILYGFSD